MFGKFTRARAPRDSGGLCATRMPLTGTAEEPGQTRHNEPMQWKALRTHHKRKHGPRSIRLAGQPRDRQPACHPTRGKSSLPATLGKERILCWPPACPIWPDHQRHRRQGARVVLLWHINLYRPTLRQGRRVTEAEDIDQRAVGDATAIHTKCGPRVVRREEADRRLGHSQHTQKPQGQCPATPLSYP